MLTDLMGTVGIESISPSRSDQNSVCYEMKSQTKERAQVGPVSVGYAAY